MATTLAGIALPDDIVWLDELQWEPVQQQLDRTVTGALVAQESTLTGGRPMTLGGVWVTRATALQLRVLADAADATHALVLRGAAAIPVRFRRPALSAVPVVVYADPAAGDHYELTLNLLQV